MAYTTINKSSLHMNTKLYTGNGGTQSITGVGFQPDLVWGKNRSTTNWHDLEDSVRGATKRLSSNSTDAEATETVNFTSFDSDGFSVGSGANVNGNGNNIVVWNWKANGAGSANTAGSISSTVSVNTTSGFSIVTYTGTGSDATIGHGLNSAPEMIIQKNTDFAYNWYSWHKDIGIANYIELNTTSAAESTDSGGDSWNNTLPTSSVFSIGSDGGTNRSGDTHLAYCFHSVQGYSKFGSYVGNGSSDGSFCFTGMKPSFVMIKKTDSAGNYWHIYDNKRSSSGGSNVINDVLYPNRSDAEYSEDRIDFVSNGFKIRNTNGDINTSGGNYIFMAFAEAPLVGTNNVPCTAR